MLLNVHIYFAAITHWPSHHSTSGVFLVNTRSTFASHIIPLFMPVTFLRCARSYFPSSLLSKFHYRYCQHNVRRNSPLRFTAVIHTRVRYILSYSDVAYIRVFREEKGGSCHPFHRLLWSCWRYYLGDKPKVNPSVSKTSFIKACFPDAPIESQCRICSLFPVAAAVSPFRINRLWTKQPWPG